MFSTPAVPIRARRFDVSAVLDLASKSTSTVRLESCCVTILFRTSVFPSMAMSQILYSSILGLYLILALQSLSKLSRRLRYVRLKQANGCEDPPKYPHQDPIWGFDLYHKMKQAGQDGNWLSTSKRLFQGYGKTYEVNLIGEKMIHTMDPRNMQTVWANNNKDWGLQPLREGLASPFFGKAILNSDGLDWQYSRSLIKPTFARIEVANLKSLGKHTDRFLARLPRDGSTIDLQELLSYLV